MKKFANTSGEEKGADVLIDLFGCEERGEILPSLAKVVFKSSQ